jgi:hypothetical protein
LTSKGVDALGPLLTASFIRPLQTAARVISGAFPRFCELSRERVSVDFLALKRAILKAMNERKPW